MMHLGRRGQPAVLSATFSSASVDAVQHRCTIESSEYARRALLPVAVSVSGRAEPRRLEGALLYTVYLYAHSLSRFGALPYDTLFHSDNADVTVIPAPHDSRPQGTTCHIYNIALIVDRNSEIVPTAIGQRCLRKLGGTWCCFSGSSRRIAALCQKRPYRLRPSALCVPSP